MTAACVIHPTRQAPPPLPDSKACTTCVAGLEQDLADIDRLLPVLRSMLDAGGVVAELRRSGSYSTRAPLRLDVLSLLDPRTTDGPDIVIPRWAHIGNVVPSGAALRWRLSWFTEQSEILLRSFAREIRNLANELRRVCGPAHGTTADPPPAPRRVAACRREHRGVECGGPIVVAPGADTAICQKCREGWPRDRWPFLARLQETA